MMLLFNFSFLQTFAATACSKDKFLGLLVPWYQYLNLKINTTTGACDFQDFQNTNAGVGGLLDTKSPVFLIMLAVLDDLIRLAALVAVGYVIYGGIQYVTSQGSPDSTRKAQQTIINALIGVTMATLAAAIVGFIGNSLGGAPSSSGLLGSLPQSNTTNVIQNVLNIVFGITAGISVLMVTIGGFRYIAAHGDPNGVAQARQTIIYSVVGLLVTMAAYSIVTFVVGRLG
ncbi:MAG TPA: pilin [Candidatus Saccharimonadia bacterium]|nr:pilin [Candidatus Saccharimonadia bacterium]